MTNRAIEKQDDPLSGEISVSAEITESSLSASAKSRALIALDRLLGNVIDIPGAYIEAAAKTIRTKSSIKQNLLKIEGAAAEKKLLEISEVGEQVIRNFLRDQQYKQTNRAVVALEAVELLKISGPNDNNDVPGDLNIDWLNRFDEFAQQASSDHLRKLWAQVLSGEVRRPGTFSLSTLRFMSELDMQTAQLFERNVSGRSSEGYILKSDQELKGQDLLDYTFLVEVGLINDLQGFTMPLTRQDDGFCNYKIGNFVLRIKSKNLPSINYWKLTRTGKEISTILGEADDQNFLEQIGKKFFDQSEIIELHKVKELSGLSAKTEFIKKIK